MRTSPSHGTPPGRRRPRLLTLVVVAAAALATLSTELEGPPHQVAATSREAPAGGADGGSALDPSRPRTPASPSPSPTAPSPSPDGTTSRSPTAERPGPPPRLSPEGWLVAGGRSRVAGRSGQLVTYTVELAVRPGRGVDLDDAAAAVTAILSDRDHGWTATGAWRLQRIDEPAAAQLRVLLAEPAIVDERCAVAGLDTRGYFSCFNGAVAALNIERWLEAVLHVRDLDLYRTYLVNHEVGHGLGYGHERCPAPGALAPVMMQLTVSDEGCEPNGVPFP